MTVLWIRTPLDAILRELATRTASSPLGLFGTPAKGPKPATRIFSFAIKYRAVLKFPPPQAQPEVCLLPPPFRAPACVISASDRCVDVPEYGCRPATTSSAPAARGASP